eukprot:gene7916-4317_t
MQVYAEAVMCNTEHGTRRVYVAKLRRFAAQRVEARRRRDRAELLLCSTTRGLQLVYFATFSAFHVWRRRRRRMRQYA